MDQGPSTPDIERLPFALEPSTARDRVRTRIGSAALVHAALWVGSTAGPHLPAATQRRLERAWAAAVVRALRIDVRATGLDAIAGGSAHLVMPLHESFVDIPVLLRLPLPMRFVVRSQLLDYPAMGRYLTATDQLPIVEEPGMADLRRLETGARAILEAGESLVVFPQGSVLGIESAFQRGTVWLARRLDVPVLPVVITGTHRVWGYPFSTTVRYGETVDLVVLPPIPPSALDRSAFRELERRMKRIAVASDAPARRYVPARDGWWDGYRFEIDPDFPELATAVAERRTSRNGG